jgi:hypothetical protein
MSYNGALGALAAGQHRFTHQVIVNGGSLRLSVGLQGTLHQAWSAQER